MIQFWSVDFLGIKTIELADKICRLAPPHFEYVWCYYSFSKSANATIHTGGKFVSAGRKFHVFTGPVNQQSDSFTIRIFYFCGIEE